MEDNKFKEKTPQETIAFLSELLLKELGTIPTFSLIHNPQLKVASCHLFLSSDPAIGANGKGVNPLYAIASGYSELLERLSSYICVGRNFDVPYFADEHLNGDGALVSPFYNPITNSFEDYELIKTLGCSTGMAAGNSYPEAIVQGLCEILERHCTNKFFHKELKINSVIENSTISYVDIVGVEKKFNAKALFFEVSPISIPVVLMILLRDNNTVGINFGCAPSLQIACERCVTEFLQNNDSDFSFKFMPVIDCPPNFKINYYCYIINGITFLPKEIIDSFFHNNPIDYARLPLAPIKTFTSNIEVLKEFLLNIDYFHEILIRDYGFLGYPAIQVLIPTLNDPVIQCHDIDHLEVYNYLGLCYQKYTNHNDFIKEYFRKMINCWLTLSVPIHYELKNKLYQKSILFDSRQQNNFDFFKKF